MAEEISKGNAGMEHTKKRLREKSDGFKMSLGDISDAIHVRTQNYHAMAGDIENALLSLQFQDYLSDKIRGLSDYIVSAGIPDPGHIVSMLCKKPGLPR